MRANESAKSICSRQSEILVPIYQRQTARTLAQFLNRGVIPIMADGDARHSVLGCLASQREPALGRLSLCLLVSRAVRVAIRHPRSGNEILLAVVIRHRQCLHLDRLMYLNLHLVGLVARLAVRRPVVKAVQRQRAICALSISLGRAVRRRKLGNDLDEKRLECGNRRANDGHVDLEPRPEGDVDSLDWNESVGGFHMGRYKEQSYLAADRSGPSC
jgi:hypothetical protein